MSYSTENPYASFGFVAEAPADVRADFIRKTYVNLAGAVGAFVVLQAVMFTSGIAEGFSNWVFSTQFAWIGLMLGFIAVSWVAESWARSAVSIGAQYAGLGLYIAAEAVFFVPLLYLARSFETPENPIILPAAVTTLAIFGGLTAIVFVTGKDFSFLRTALMLGMLIAFALVVGSIFLGFNLGFFFTLAMVALACGYILYYTSNVLHHYRPGQHVVAALALFAAVALLFWYILQLFMSRD